MQKIQLIQNSPPASNQQSNPNYQQSYLAIDKATILQQQREQFKMQMNYFDYFEQDKDNEKTRNSTFSKASDGREEIKKSVVTF